MGQDSHKKYKEFKEAERQLKPWSSDEKRQEVRIKELEYKLQDQKDNEEYERTDKMFDYFNGRN